MTKIPLIGTIVVILHALLFATDERILVTPSSIIGIPRPHLLQPDPLVIGHLLVQLPFDFRVFLGEFHQVRVGQLPIDAIVVPRPVMPNVIQRKFRRVRYRHSNAAASAAAVAVAALLLLLLLRILSAIAGGPQFRSPRSRSIITLLQARGDESQLLLDAPHRRFDDLLPRGRMLAQYAPLGRTRDQRRGAPQEEELSGRVRDVEDASRVEESVSVGGVDGQSGARGYDRRGIDGGEVLRFRGEGWGEFVDG